MAAAAVLVAACGADGAEAPVERSAAPTTTTTEPVTTTATEATTTTTAVAPGTAASVHDAGLPAPAQTPAELAQRITAAEQAVRDPATAGDALFRAAFEQ